MKIERIQLQNFRCFGPTPVSIDLEPTTVLLGGNAAGKTAALLALARLFAPSQALRNLERGDFHVPLGTNYDDLAKIDLVVDVLLTVEEGKDRSATEEIASQWAQVFVTSPQGKLYARARLEATWRRVAGQPEGEIEPSYWWITSLDDSVDDSQRRRMHPHERAGIQVHYIPGSRDPDRQLRNVSGTMLHRLFGALKWSAKAENAVLSAASSVQATLTAESGLALLEKAVKTGWADLHAGPKPEVPSFRFVGANLADVLGSATLQFAPAPGGGAYGIDRLSEGQASLLYLALVSAVFDFESALLHEASDPSSTATYTEAANLDRLDPPVLTVFAVEEPENHLAPHFLGPIFAKLQAFAKTRRAQTIVASHAPSLLSRVEPSAVRHLRINEKRESNARAICLPAAQDEAFKFVKEAVRAYPELYFAKVVVLGEGDSEEVVLPRLLRACGLDLDKSLLSVVPLGGRFVHHFWRLLTALEIPFITLLDLDWDRHGGGWGRIKYALAQLAKQGVDPATVTAGLPRDASAPQTGPLNIDTLHKWTDWNAVPAWLDRLEEHNIFFSSPLDIDFGMLKAFPGAYQGVEPDFALPADADKRAALHQRARIAVLKASGGTLNTGYEAADEDRFAWYDRLFLGRGKPLVHMHALSSVTDSALTASAPPELLRLYTRVAAMVK